MMPKQMPALAVALAIATTGALAGAADANELVRDTDVEFIPLNPKRGDASPRAGALWGNIRENVPSGMLVTFQDGFSSPPHIHNITYRAVVIKGEVHNDDPAAAEMWMGPGSFWVQPLGEDHITASRGENEGERGVIFLEILSGPYLVQPSDQAFDDGERPINVEARNVVWLDSDAAQWIEADGVEMSYLWGNLRTGEKSGSFVRMPAGFFGTISTEAPLLRAVTIQGTTEVTMSGESATESLNPGSYFGSRGAASHAVSCTSEEACILYMHAEGVYTLTAS
ncbi:DUF4437 domain-containing protein [Microbulbifer sp. S227A]|uniref:DUF4437 domain-containing protein n=1 Tax=Microbulbifer sp. S227A TaxID=3415131 RepID=UPI003C7E4D02